MKYRYDRKVFLKDLYKQYGDLPKEIFQQIVEYKTKEKNKTYKIVMNKESIGSILWINEQINKIKKEISIHVNLRDLTQGSKDWLYLYNNYDKPRMLQEMLYSLQQDKRKIIMDCRLCGLI